MDIKVLAPQSDSLSPHKELNLQAAEGLECEKQTASSKVRLVHELESILSKRNYARISVPL